MLNPSNVPLLDLKAQYATIRDEICAAVDAVLESQQCILGPAVAECEAKLAEYCRSPHAITVSSGSDALLVSLMAENMGAGDEVITTPYTFFATAGAIARTGARPVFVDIDPQTYNIDPGQIEARISQKTKALMPVHLYGQCAEMDPDPGDCRPARNSGDRGRRPGDWSGIWGSAGGHDGPLRLLQLLSLEEPGAAGDGGLVTTGDAAAAERLRVLRVHGSKPKYYHALIGGNFRFDSLQAAIVSVKLRYLDQWTAGRQANAARYRRLFEAAGLTGGGQVQLPYEVPGNRHIYNQFVIRARRRDELFEHLKGQSVGVEIYYPVPLHLQQCFAYLGYRPGDFPASEAAAQQTLALPIYPELADAQAQQVVDSIARFFAP